MIADAVEAHRELEGLTVLVVEDETLIALLVEDMLLDLGCASVLHVGAARDAVALLSERRPDAAVLDVNLAGEPAFALAAHLETAGVPFIFATGYGREGVPAPLRQHPVIQKPYALSALAAALQSALADRGDAAVTRPRA